MLRTGQPRPRRTAAAVHGRRRPGFVRPGGNGQGWPPGGRDKASANAETCSDASTRHTGAARRGDDGACFCKRAARSAAMHPMGASASLRAVSVQEFTGHAQLGAAATALFPAAVQLSTDSDAPIGCIAIAQRDAGAGICWMCLARHCGDTAFSCSTPRRQAASTALRAALSARLPASLQLSDAWTQRSSDPCRFSRRRRRCKRRRCTKVAHKPR